MTDTRPAVERMIKADPEMAAAEIARVLGVSRERVRQLLAEMGYTLHWKRARKHRTT